MAHQGGLAQRPSDAYAVVWSAAGGFGDPMERDPQAVAKDFDNLAVTTAARCRYMPSCGSPWWRSRSRPIADRSPRIRLNGATLSDLPVVQSLKFELAINLKTAKNLGFEFPATFIARAQIGLANAPATK